MKRSLMAWLAISLLLDFSAEVKAHDDAQATTSTRNQNDSQQVGQTGRQPANERSALQAVVVQLQASDNLSYLPTAAQSNGYWTANNIAWGDMWSRAADLSLTPVDDALRAHLGLSKDQGLIVTALAANTSAAQAGIQQNDVLLKLGDASLAKPDDLEEGLKGAGDKPASLTFLRRGEKLTVQVQPQVRVTMGPVRPEPPAFWIGVSVSPLEPALRSQLKLPQNQGLLAIDVSKDSPAARAEVKVHDILLSLAEKPLDSQQKLVEIVQSNGEKPISLKLIREGKTRTIQVMPMHRKPTQLQIELNVTQPQTYSYQYVRPGVVVANPASSGDSMSALTFQAQGADAKQPQDATATVSRRLDDFDAEIKQLRKAIEELSKILRDKK